ncbi:MAG: 3-oxoacyl-ACP synthase, partial [Shewanella sp.]
MSKITGFGKATLAEVMTNAQWSQYVQTDDEWIRSRTGIEQRYITSQSTTQIAIQAAQAAITQSGIDPQTIGLIIVATMSASQVMPSTAASVQAAIGAGA